MIINQNGVCTFSNTKKRELKLEEEKSQEKKKGIIIFTTSQQIKPYLKLTNYENSEND